MLTGFALTGGVKALPNLATKFILSRVTYAAEIRCYGSLRSEESGGFMLIR